MYRLILLLFLVIFADHHALASLPDTLDSGWTMTRTRAPFEEVTLLEKRGEIGSRYRFDAKDQADPLHCTLLIAPTFIVIDYPYDRFVNPKQKNEFTQDVVFRLNTKHGSELMGIFPCTFTEYYKNRNLLLFSAHDSKPMLRQLKTGEFRTLYVFLRELPKRKPGQHPSEVVKHLDKWTFKFDLSAVEGALIKQARIARE